MMTTIGEESGLAAGIAIASGIETHAREEVVRVVGEAMIMTGIEEDARAVAATIGAGTIAANGTIGRRSGAVESAPTWIPSTHRTEIRWFRTKTSREYCRYSTDRRKGLRRLGRNRATRGLIWRRLFRSWWEALAATRDSPPSSTTKTAMTRPATGPRKIQVSEDIELKFQYTDYILFSG